jgi:Zn-dependent metalloprotease
MTAMQTARIGALLAGLASTLLRGSAVLDQQQPGHTLTPRVSFTDALGQKHTRLIHYFHGVRVWGSEAIIHLDRLGHRLPDVAPDPDLALATRSTRGGSLVRAVPIHLDLEPSLPVAKACRIIREHLGPAGSEAVFPSWEKVIYPIFRTLASETPGRPLNAADILRVVDGHLLAWLIRAEVSGGPSGDGTWDYLVDAHTGRIIERIPVDLAELTPSDEGKGRTWYSGEVKLDTARTEAGDYELVDLTRGKGGPFGGNAVTNQRGETGDRLGEVFTSRDNVWGTGKPGLGRMAHYDEDVATNGADAAYGLRCAWDYFLNIHGRLGWDDQNTAVTVRTQWGGNRYGNSDGALWSPKLNSIFIMAGDDYFPRTGLFTLGHEFTHGVTQASAGLEYKGEPGGLNEATSDIFGKMVETYARKHHASGPVIGVPDDWAIYKFEAGSGNPSLLRNMKNPRQADDPGSWFYGLYSEDPHHASGPMNRAFYFLAQGASADATNDSGAYSGFLPAGMAGIGTDKAARIWYRALTVYLKPWSNYLSARDAAVKAAEDLYPDGPEAVLAVRKAFWAINVGSPDPAPAGEAVPLAVTATLERGNLTFLAAGTGIHGATFWLDDLIAGWQASPPYALTLKGPHLFANGLHRWKAVVEFENGSRKEVHGEFTCHGPVQQELKDPGFEARGDRPWGQDRPRTLAGPQGPPLPRPHGGSEYAVFSRDASPDRDPVLAQTVTIPAGTRQVLLSFWSWTSASSANPGQDRLQVQVRSVPDSREPARVLAEVATLTGLDAWNDWQEHVIAIPALADQTGDRTVEVRLQCSLAHDDAVFRIDDLKLLCASSPQPYLALASRKATLRPGGAAVFSARVLGCANQTLTWRLKEGNGGTLTEEGAYTAPEEAGTYHAVATAAADPDATGELSIIVQPGD